MNPAVKKLWVEHLQSDWYEQNFTPDEDGYVPMRTIDNKWSPFGVLCNIHAQKFPMVAIEQPEVTEYMDYEYLIPYHVAMWAGLDEYTTVMPFDRVVDILGEKFYNIEQMFNRGAPFYIIADMIDIHF